MQHLEIVISKRNHCKEDFEFLKVIGRGGFSRVLMARKKDSGQLFAVKAIQKVHLQQEDKAKTTMAEIKIN